MSSGYIGAGSPNTGLVNNNVWNDIINKFRLNDNQKKVFDTDMNYKLSPSGIEDSVNKVKGVVGSTSNIGNVGKTAGNMKSFLDWAASHGMPWLKNANNLRKFASHQASSGSKFKRLVNTPTRLRSAEKMLNGGKGANVIDPAMTVAKATAGLGGAELVYLLAKNNSGINPGTEVKAGGGVVNPLYINNVDNKDVKFMNQPMQDNPVEQLYNQNANTINEQNYNKLVGSGKANANFNNPFSVHGIINNPIGPTDNKIDFNLEDIADAKARGLVLHTGEVDSRGNPVEPYWDYPNQYQNDYISSASENETYDPVTGTYINYS